jgi:hypothetical protein
MEVGGMAVAGKARPEVAARTIAATTTTNEDFVRGACTSRKPTSVNLANPKDGLTDF